MSMCVCVCAEFLVHLCGHVRLHGSPMHQPMAISKLAGLAQPLVPVRPHAQEGLCHYNYWVRLSYVCLCVLIYDHSSVYSVVCSWYYCMGLPKKTRFPISHGHAITCVAGSILPQVPFRWMGFNNRFLGVSRRMVWHVQQAISGEESNGKSHEYPLGPRRSGEFLERPGFHGLTTLLTRSAYPLVLADWESRQCDGKAIDYTAMAPPRDSIGTAMALPWNCHGFVMAVLLPWQCPAGGIVVALILRCHGITMAASWQDWLVARTCGFQMDRLYIHAA